MLLRHDLPPLEPAAVGQHPGEAGVVTDCRDKIGVTHVERRVPGVEAAGGRFEFNQPGVGVPVAGRRPVDAASGHPQSGVAQAEGSEQVAGQVILQRPAGHPGD